MNYINKKNRGCMMRLGVKKNSWRLDLKNIIIYVKKKKKKKISILRSYYGCTKENIHFKKYIKLDIFLCKKNKWKNIFTTGRGKLF